MEYLHECACTHTCPSSCGVETQRNMTGQRGATPAYATGVQHLSEYEARSQALSRQLRPCCIALPCTPQNNSTRKSVSLPCDYMWCTPGESPRSRSLFQATSNAAFVIPTYEALHARFILLQ
jgi:hypothetical protein